MTNNEALQELKASIVGQGFQCHTETYQKAIEALEKHTPKKPKGVYDENESEKGEPLYEKALIGGCPCCGFEVQEGMNYCVNCGQRILWEYEK